MSTSTMAKVGQLLLTTVGIICFFLPIDLTQFAQIEPMTWHQFIVAEQGQNRCPDAAHAGAVVTLKTLSAIDCCRLCLIREGCLHVDFNTNFNICHHYYSTPSKLVAVEGCRFLVNPPKFEGCFAPATMRTTSDCCSFPFQYDNKEHNQCITLNDTSQCVAANGELADCITPPGFSVQQLVSPMPEGITAPLPCIGNWIILMSRYNGSVDFVRNWTDYRNGFGDIGGTEFWLGNEITHMITSSLGLTFMLRVELQTYTKGLWYFAEYQTFRLESEANLYTMHVTNYSGNAGDSLSTVQNGMRFSTPDADNDLKEDGSCSALNNNASWWFRNCFFSCLTGPYNTKTFAWQSLITYGAQGQGRLRAARMMMRRM